MKDDARKKHKGDSSKKSLYPVGLKRIDRKEWQMNILEKFTEQQLEILYSNGRDQKWKNNVPVAFLQMKTLPFSVLLTELYEDEPNFGYGLSSNDSHLEVGVIDLTRITKIAEDNADFLISKISFTGKYPLAVYAKVADSLGGIVTDDSEAGHAHQFQEAAKGKYADQNENLQALQRRFTWL